MAQPPSKPSSPWWVMPLLVVLALLGVLYLIRLVVGFVFASIGTLVILALLVGGFVWFTRSRT